jgi:hypothetical protein
MRGGIVPIFCFDASSGKPLFPVRHALCTHYGKPGFYFDADKMQRTNLMERLRIHDTDDAVSGLMALRKVLSVELGKIEKLTEEGETFVTIDALDETAFSVEECKQIRAAILSALASVDELFGWVRLLAEKDVEGNDLECTRSLPEVNIATRN